MRSGRASGMSNVHKVIMLLRSAWAPSVFGAVWFSRWVITHSQMDSDFRGHQPTVCIT